MELLTSSTEFFGPTSSRVPQVLPPESQPLLVFPRQQVRSPPSGAEKSVEAPAPDQALVVLLAAQVSPKACPGSARNPVLEAFPAAAHRLVPLTLLRTEPSRK